MEPDNFPKTKIYNQLITESVNKLLEGPDASELEVQRMFNKNKTLKKVLSPDYKPETGVPENKLKPTKIPNIDIPENDLHKQAGKHLAIGAGIAGAGLAGYATYRILRKRKCKQKCSEISDPTSRQKCLSDCR
jgi:hypothetical protein